MVQIHFIINPIAGSGNNNFLEKLLKDNFPKEKYNIKIKLTKHKGHAVDLTINSVKETPNIIVACGGDGTINEVASNLIETTILLGIIPIGSGNGLASNLKISKNVKEAIKIIKNNCTTQIDVGCFNNKYFFSNAGIGFDASVIENYEIFNTRTLYSYLKASIKAFKNIDKQNDLTIGIDEGLMIRNPFLIFISNSNEMGYNLSLTPKASLNDGLLDIVIISEISKFKIMLLGVLMFFKRIELLREVKSYQSKSLSLLIKTGASINSQIDGELQKIEDVKIKIIIKQKSLTILV